MLVFEHDHPHRRYRRRPLALALRRRVCRDARPHAGVELAGLQDTDAALAAERAAQLGSPPVFTDWRRMLDEVRPDFVIVLGRHCDMAGVAHALLDEGRSFLVEKPAGVNAREVLSFFFSPGKKRR